MTLVPITKDDRKACDDCGEVGPLYPVQHMGPVPDVSLLCLECAHARGAAKCPECETIWAAKEGGEVVTICPRQSCRNA